MSKKAIHWSGVFPAVSTQFRSDYSLDLDATHAVMKNLVKDGVSGLVVCGSVGENTSLSTDEKLQIIEVAKDAAGGKIPVSAGVAEFTTAFAQKMAKEAERVGVDGIMVMPALVYSSKPHETAAHFRSVASATDLPIMVYNNPPIYKNDVTPDILATLTDCDNIVCFKDSSGDTRRFIDLRNTVGDRRGRLDLRNVQRLPARRGNVIPSRPPAALRRGDGAVPLVHAAAASRCASGSGAVHQAV